MATAAITAEFSIVNIVRPVAVAAAGAQFQHFWQRLAVAIVAGYVDVRADNLEICLRIVVKMPLQPVNRVMAGRTIGVEATLVLVVISVAVDALLRGILEHMCFVAGFAVGFGMRTQQRKARQVMIEK